jgi:hypothetical protein
MSRAQVRPGHWIATWEDVDVSGSGSAVGLNRGLALTWEGEGGHLGDLGVSERQGAGVKAVQPASYAKYGRGQEAG